LADETSPRLLFGSTPMKYEIAPLFCRPWTLNGISPRLIESHYEHIYGGALHQLNAIARELASLDPGTTPAEVISRLKRDELTALNSTLLHELYFASLGGDGSAGWVLLTYVPRDGRLINQTASEHGQNIAGGIPILALDMYEHAYQSEFGANATAYVAAFMRNIDWNAVQARHENAVEVEPPIRLVQPQFGDLPSITPEEVQGMLDSGVPVQIIDARPRHYTTRSHEMMEGAIWRDPERLDDWIGELSKTEPVVTFCVYGFHVGCETAVALRKAGFDAKYMAGGHYAWKAIKGSVKLFDQA
jgi:Fe-Mn family superoxide dismutase